MLNPVPFAYQLVDGITWFLYSLLIYDAYMSYSGILAIASSVVYLVYLHALGWHMLSDRLHGTELAVGDNVYLNYDPPISHDHLSDRGSQLSDVVVDISRQPGLIHRQLERSLKIVVLGVIVVMSVLTVPTYLPDDGSLSSKMVLLGVVSAITHCLMYSAPISIAYEIVKHPQHVRNLFNMRLAVVRALNALLWMTFGAALGNAFIVAAYVFALVCALV